MKAFALLTTQAVAGPSAFRYYANGRRLTQEAWHDLFAAALRYGKVDTSHTYRKGSRWFHRCQARIPE